LNILVQYISVIPAVTYEKLFIQIVEEFNVTYKTIQPRFSSVELRSLLSALFPQLMKLFYTPQKNKLMCKFSDFPLTSGFAVYFSFY